MTIRYGIIFRSFAKTEESIKEVVSRAIESANIASSVEVQGKKFFEKIVFLVPTKYDCGKTADAIREEMRGNDIVAVLEADGHHSCEALNSGLRYLDLLGITHAAIVSNKARAYLTESTLLAIGNTFLSGAKVAGVALSELREIVLEGRVQNTFAVWDIEAVLNLDVPGFDSRSGVEEIAPSVRLIRKYGACIAVIHPPSVGLDIRSSKDGLERHKEVMETKINRQSEEVERVASDFNFIIKSGVMHRYTIT